MTCVYHSVVSLVEHDALYQVRYIVSMLGSVLTRCLEWNNFSQFMQLNVKVQYIFCLKCVLDVFMFTIYWKAQSIEHELNISVVVFHTRSGDIL